MLTSLIDFQIERPAGSYSQISLLFFLLFFLPPLLPPYCLAGPERSTYCFYILFILINMNLEIIFQYHQTNLSLVEQL